MLDAVVRDGAFILQLSAREHLKNDFVELKGYLKLNLHLVGLASEGLDEDLPASMGKKSQVISHVFGSCSLTMSCHFPAAFQRRSDALDPDGAFRGLNLGLDILDGTRRFDSRVERSFGPDNGYEKGTIVLACSNRNG
ncbi:hypothetical protein RvY_02277 [Ramazzottius varieornatus]|uniref:Uncharacterized protein n=1 Tax=Ramazzottius varieornatus TaxID=947166 RepID=A0A1D1UJ85_RAMVA|nr:hypothetical protein RvY_02277 [Ramazzottius varieornatus]